MPRPDGRIEPGQPVRGAISAKAWNRAQDAADIVLGAHTGTKSTIGPFVEKTYTWAWCTNNTGSDLTRWSVVELSQSGYLQNIRNLSDGSAYSGRADAVTLFEATPILSGVKPRFQGYDPYNSGSVSVTPATAYPFGICVEPIAYGMMGRVAVSGIVQANVYVPSGFPSIDWNSGMKARTDYGDTTKLVADYDGTAEVIWSEETPTSLSTQTRRALIRLGVQQPPKLLQGTVVPSLSPDNDFFWRKDEYYTATVYNPSRTVPAKARVWNRMAGFSVVPHNTYVPSTLSPIGVTFAAMDNEWRLVSIVSSTISY